MGRFELQGQGRLSFTLFERTEANESAAQRGVVGNFPGCPRLIQPPQTRARASRGDPASISTSTSTRLKGLKAQAVCPYLMREACR
jgi:hypothetical protein